MPPENSTGGADEAVYCRQTRTIYSADRCTCGVSGADRIDMVLFSGTSPLDALDADSHRRCCCGAAVYTAAAHVVLHHRLQRFGDAYHPEVRHFLCTGTDHAHPGAPVQQHFSCAVFGKDRDELHSAPCLRRHSHSGVSEPLRCGGDPGVSAKDGVQPQPASVEQPVLPEEGPDFDVFESAMQETKAPPADDTERSEP